MTIHSFLMLYVVTSASLADPMDWPSWRGPHQNSISNEIGLIDRFDPNGGPGSNLVWKNEAAAGISTPIVMNGRLYTIVRDQPGTSKDAEKVICLNAMTGAQIWQNVYNVFLSDLPAERVGWSNVAGDPETNCVFSLGACCLLQAMDGATGKTVWSHSMSEEFGMLSTYGGRTNTPVVFEDLVIISGVTTGWGETARPAHRFFAFNKKTGELIWSNSTRPLPEDTTYSTPIIRVIDGQSVMVAGSGDGNVYGIQPRTGTILWHNALSRRGVNTSVAIDDEGNVYATHGEENPTGTNMGAVVKIDAVRISRNSAVAETSSVAAETWRMEELTVGKSSPLLLGDRVYVVEDSSRMHVLDRETGEPIGSPLKLGTAMRGSLVAADGKIYACTATGVFHVLRPTDDGIKSVFKLRLPPGHDVGGSPIISHGRVYLPTTAGLFCLGDTSKTAKLGSGPNLPLESDVATDQTIAQLQLVPAETMVASGTQLALNVVAFNARGQRLDRLPADLQFSVDGPGTIGADGIFHSPAANSHVASTVTVKSGDKVATSRLRTIPPLPWSFDFGDHEVPLPWIGARYRHVPRVVDGEPMIVKIATIPKGTRSQTWFGPTELHDYTITADLRAQPGTAKLPDMGVIAQRYTLDLMGESQKLQIRTWAAQLRMAKSVPVTWQAGVWYRLKLQASVEGGVSVLRGKVWPRDAAEPNEWTVTARDEAPNLQGSPGLFGNATNGEVLIDNVKVVSNE